MKGSGSYEKIIHRKFSTYNMGMQVPYSVCAKIQKKRNIWKIKKRNRNDIEGIM